MNSADTTHDVPVFARRSDTPNGSAKLVIFGGKPNIRSELLIITGSDASDDRVLNATTCTGNTARANFGNDTLPKIATMPYNMKPATTNRPQCTTRKRPTAPAIPAPILIASGTASAKTPSGARANTHATMTIMASATPRKNCAPAVRNSDDVRERPAANNTANTISDNMTPSTATLNGFDDTRPTSQLVNVGSC